MADINVLTSALAYSMLALSTGSIPAHDPYLGFSLPCVRLPLSVKLPLFGPLEGIQKNETVDGITFQFEAASDVPSMANAPQYEVGNTLMHIIGPTFTNFYERQAEWLADNVSTDPNQWPMLFRFARVIRNAVVHFGVVTIRNANSQPVSWSGLTYSPADNGRAIYVNDMNTGDFIALMVEIDRAMDELGAPD